MMLAHSQCEEILKSSAKVCLCFGILPHWGSVAAKLCEQLLKMISGVNQIDKRTEVAADLKASWPTAYGHWFRRFLAMQTSLANCDKFFTDPCCFTRLALMMLSATGGNTVILSWMNIKNPGLATGGAFSNGISMGGGSQDANTDAWTDIYIEHPTAIVPLTYIYILDHSFPLASVPMRRFPCQPIGPSGETSSRNWQTAVNWNGRTLVQGTGRECFEDVECFHIHVDLLN